jgi:dolichyl-phosphate-mannose-protein mannosyltransferase
MPQLERRAFVLLLVLSAALHLFRLSEPRSLVFDEVHFGGFAEAYCCSGQYFFDVHPPHAKLLLAGVLALGGYTGGQKYEHVRDPYTELSPFLIRLAPALAGTALPLLLLALLLELGARPAAAFLGGLAVTLDNALLLQTRTATLDGVLMVATLGSLLAGLVALRSPPRRALGWALFAGVLAGLAVGSKFTGLVSLGLIALVFGIHFAEQPESARLRRVVAQGACVLAGFAAVYTAGWLLHYALLTGPGAAGSGPPPTGHFFADVVALHGEMLRRNAGLTTPHPSASPWWSWPLMLRPIFYWTGMHGDTLHLIGNPVVWWGSALGLLLTTAAWLALRITDLRIGDQTRAWPPRLWIPLAGYLLAFAPLARISRPLFLYHYFTPLLFSICITMLWLDHVGWTRPGGWSAQRLSYRFAAWLLIAGFAAVSPLTFSFLNAPDYERAVFALLPGWR